MSKKIGFVSSAVLLHNVEELLNIFVEDIVTKSIATGTAVENWQAYNSYCLLLLIKFTLFRLSMFLCLF